MTERGVVVVKRERAPVYFGRHPWVFAGAIDAVSGDPADGAEVEVRTTTGQFIAFGLYNKQSKIAVRLYSWRQSQPVDDGLFRERIRSAIAMRRDVLGLASGEGAAYRVVFSEADQLSGLVVDRYGDYLTCQFTGLGLAARRESIARILMEETGARGVYLRTEKGVGALEGVELHDGLLAGEMPPEGLVIRENGLSVRVNLAEGQKTGYYLDQRDNRRRVGELARGRRVLDAFCYSGGFGLSAAKGGASEVVCLDASEAALGLAKANAELNGFPQVQLAHGNALTELPRMSGEGQKFDLVVLDPPKFARNRAALPKAFAGYRKLHQHALKLLNPGGILVTCCCTGLITQAEFEDVIVQVATQGRRDVQILERRGASADHPVAAACRETGYLKCVVARAV